MSISESDRVKIAIRDFFNEKWRKVKKMAINVKVYNLDDLINEYHRVYGTKLSRAQIIGFLADAELKRVKELPNYNGKYLESNLTKIKQKWQLVESKPFSSSDEEWEEELDDDFYI